MNRQRVTVLGLVLIAVSSGAPEAQQESAFLAAEDPAPAKASEGLVFHLSEGRAEAPLLVARPPASQLDERTRRSVLDRLPPWGQETLAEPFAFPESSLPPPRTGTTTPTTFPPPDSAERTDSEPSGPLRVLRRAPEGEVPLAPHVSITFSAPMVRVSSHGALAAEAVPVRLRPEPPGEWRWVGTRTLLFEPEGRFPMATEYEARVGPETRDAGGKRIGSSVAWNFSTPPPRLLTRHPNGGPASREAVLFVAFDQRIEPASVLAGLRVRAGDQELPLRLATQAEVETDDAVARLAEQAEDGRFVAFRARQPLPADTPLTVELSAGTPSAEGPRITQEGQEWSFRTYGAFQVTEHRCGHEPRGCTPQDAWVIRFTNPMDAQAFREDSVRVDPPLPSLRAFVQGPRLVLRGLKKGRTEYRVTLSPEIQDTFSQPLEPGEVLRFDVGAARKVLHSPGGDFVVLDPLGGGGFSVFSVNHPELAVEAWSVGPEDWPAWHAYRQASWRNLPRTPPGRKVLETTVRPGARPDELVETRIDLTPALDGGLGQLVVVVRPTEPDDKGLRQAVRVWVQSTHIGLDAFVDGDALLAWATTLGEARPLADVTLSLSSGERAQTDASGLARLDLLAAPSALLVAQKGRDRAILPASPLWWNERGGWRRRELRDPLRFSVFDDRGMYRPGEQVLVKGWLRRVGNGPGGDVHLDTGADELKWSLSDSQGNEVRRGTTRVSAVGSFDLELDLPQTMNLGPARLGLRVEGGVRSGSGHTHTFQVQEFRRPEFEVEAATSAGPHVVGGHATATVRAAYYAGGALPGAEVSWSVVATPAWFRPPHWDDFVFGTFVPWWGPRPASGEPTGVQTLVGRTDHEGAHRLRIDLESADPPRPRHVGAEATVQDVNRQAWTARAQFLVHPAKLYAGLRVERSFVQKGEPILLDVVIADLDGRAEAGRRVRLRAERLDWRQVGGVWKEVPEDVQERVVDSGTEPVRVSFDGKEGGSWRVLARVSDQEGRPNETELRVWVAGGRLPPRRGLEQEKVTLVPDRNGYAPGDVARILVLAPFAPAQGLLTVRRSGLLREESFTMTEASHTLEIPIQEVWTPNVHIQVDLVGATPRDEGEGAPLRPAFARGAFDLPVPPLKRRLAVEVKPREPALTPGGETVLDLTLRDAGGAAVAGGEMAVVVVDEAVLALSGYRTPDPMSVFYAARPPGVADHHLRSHVQLARLDELPDLEVEEGPGSTDTFMESAMAVNGLMPAAAAPMAARLRKASASPPIRTRSDFSALALFVPSVVTDGAGRAEVPVRLPDSLTRYRIIVVAAEGERRFGSGEATLLARLPLMVRPSPPRFLNFGDRFELPVVIQNQTNRDMTVDVALRAQNADLPESAGRRLVVAANDRAEVRFAAAAAHAGTARFQVGAVSDSMADAAQFSLPVWTPATTEAFATYGHIDDGAMTQPVEAPGGVVADFGGLEVTTSSTALQALTDALLYLVAYPFECAEQLSSRVLAVAALGDVLGAFGAEGLPDPEELEEAMARDIEQLRALQNDDGGYAFWRRGDRSWPYVSIHAAHALIRAKEKGFSVPEVTLARSLAYLQTFEARFEKDYPVAVRRALVAYGLFVRDRMGEAQPKRARALVNETEAGPLSFEALGWILPTLSQDPGSGSELESVRRQLANGVEETAAAAHFTVSYTDGAHLLLHSSRRADAVVLEALIADQPRSDVIPKLVAGLLAHRKAGRWANTQDNVFVLLALDRYFQAYEKTTPDFVARAWLGERFAGGHAFRGHTTSSRQLRIPMNVLSRQSRPTDLHLAKDGPGRLYYRIGLRYAPESLDLEPLDRGFTVERAYEAMDDEGDVRRDPDGTWHIRAGSRVRVQLTMVASARRYHVALVDPLPAGLEAVNPALRNSGTSPGPDRNEITSRPSPRGGRTVSLEYWWWIRPWFEHQNLRDERVEAFSSLLWEGVHTYSYVARATTPGTFVVPPPRAEEMYTPETFGRGGTDTVVVD